MLFDLILYYFMSSSPLPAAQGPGCQLFLVSDPCSCSEWLITLGRSGKAKAALLRAALHPQLWRPAPQHGPGHGARTAPCHQAAKSSRPSPRRPHITAAMTLYVTPANHEGPIRFLDPISSSCDLCASLRTYGYAELSLSFKCPRLVQAKWEEGPFVSFFPRAFIMMDEEPFTSFTNLQTN